MTTTRVATQTVTGTNVCEVADMIWREIENIYQAYLRDFPYDTAQLRKDLGQILLWRMCDHLAVQFYDDDMVERVSYIFKAEASDDAPSSVPGDFPRHKVPEHLHVRISAKPTQSKPVEEVAEFFDQLGWGAAATLQRKTLGITRRYGQFKSGDFAIGAYSYTIEGAEEFQL